MNIRSIYNNVFVHFRRRRMKKFFALLAPAANARVLDIGGAPNTWGVESNYGPAFPVTLYNVQFSPEAQAARFTAVQGDAAALPFADKSFDIAFSNSVIEHMGTWERQQAFAREARRVAGKLWIQTPARSFPVDPHLLAPFIHFLPKGMQRLLVRRFTPWGLMTKPTPEQVDGLLAEIRLLNYRELKQLFPDCRILKERLLGLTKSYVAVRI